MNSWRTRNPMRTEINLGDPVCDFAFESRENLKMAGLVSKTWPKIRDNAARYFLVEAERLLRTKSSKTGTWCLKSDGFDIFEARYRQPLYLTKASWKEVFFISLELKDFGKRA